MTRKKKPLPIFEDIVITDIAAEGKSLARVNDMVVFVPYTVPGDIVDLQVVKKKHHYCEATVLQYKKLSDTRATPPCQHFGVCGGCAWQILPYEEQLKAKEKQVEDQLTRIAKVQLPPISPIMGSVKQYEYRNKIEFGCSNKRWFTREELGDMPPKSDEGAHFRDDIKANNAIGFHIKGAFDKIYPISKCHLMDNLHNDIRNFIFETANQMGMTFYDIREQHGLLRDIMIRNSNTTEWMVLVQFHYDKPEDEQQSLELMQRVADRFPQITSLLYVNNQKGNDTFNDLEIQTYRGKDFIYEKMEGLSFKVGVKSFYQTNTEQAYQLYSVARDFAGLTGNELVYDLYTGTGTIANFVAKGAKQVIDRKSVV